MYAKPSSLLDSQAPNVLGADCGLLLVGTKDRSARTAEGHCNRLPIMLRSNGSWGTCIPHGVFTFPPCGWSPTLRFSRRTYSTIQKAGSGIVISGGEGLRVASASEDWEKSAAVAYLTPSELVKRARFPLHRDQRERYSSPTFLKSKPRHFPARYKP